MSKINVELEVANDCCKECQFFDYEIDYCTIFGEVITGYCRCESCLKREVKEYRSTQNEN